MYFRLTAGSADMPAKVGYVPFVESNVGQLLLVNFFKIIFLYFVYTCVCVCVHFFYEQIMMYVDCNSGVVKHVCCSLFLISDISIQFMQVTQENAPFEKYTADFPIVSVCSPPPPPQPLPLQFSCF